MLTLFQILKLRKGRFFKNYHSFLEYNHNNKVEKSCHKLEESIIKNQSDIDIQAYCAYCEKVTNMNIDYLYAIKKEGMVVPNFRERVVCSRCGLNNRLRATYHFLKFLLSDFDSKKIYITERVTPFYESLRKKVKLLIGSEYFENEEERENLSRRIGREINNEDLTRLSFRDKLFDVVISLDVLEHVGNYEKALREIYRVLKVGGTFIFTIPFLLDSVKTVKRAEIRGGNIRYLLPAEYHGDPVDEKGCLCFNNFSWDILDKLRHLGFSDVGIYTYKSMKFGYLGNCVILYAKK